MTLIGFRTSCQSAHSSLRQRQQRLAFFDEAGGELAGGDIADVLRRMDPSGGNEEDITSPWSRCPSRTSAS
jgi:hypothetical protein